jgi:polyphosphate kinase
MFTAGRKMIHGMDTVSTAAAAADRLLNRELSWLEYNARVLEQAADASLPLLERVRMCKFFASNLDEFFQVRVAGLMDQVASGLAVRSADGRTPQEALAAIRERVIELNARQSRVWRRELTPALAEAGILLATIDDLTAPELDELERRFENEVFPVLTPLGVGPGQPFPFISPLSLSLGVFARNPDGGEERFARVKVPEGLPRFLSIGTRGVLLPLESVIAHFLSWLFPGMEIEERALFRVTRDADFEVSDEADDLLEAVQVELRRRRFGDVVRLEVSESMSSAMIDRLAAGLDVREEQVYRIAGLLDLADADQIAELDRPELKEPPWSSTTQARLLPGGPGLFEEISRSDVFVHHPYESFATSFEQFVRAAATDPQVSAIKTTVYRTSGDSPLVPALVQASESGKQSVCLVELKARFDERRNIEWARSLEQAGVHVVYGFPNLKIHAKATLVVRREGSRLRRYVHVGTGNYNSVTARVYEDAGIFTADPDIAADVADLFNYLTGFGKPSRFRKLLVAPFMLRTRLVEEIRAVAAAGEKGRVRIKCNALTDPTIIEELYKASQAGATVDVISRSICMLRPGVDGMSETIRVRSVLGRFLEHSRIFVFATPERSSYFLGSADLMPRNLDHRIEIVAPVEQPRAQGEIDAIFESLLADRTTAWELGPDGRWERTRPKKNQRGNPTQAALMRRAQVRARRQAEYRNRAR